MDKNETILYIQRIMREYGVNQTQIATSIETSRQYIGQLLMGKRAITNNMKLRLDEHYPPKTSVTSKDVVSILCSKYSNKRVYIDKSLFPQYIPEEDLASCYLHIISDLSMSPEYNIQDKVIVCPLNNTFKDGNIFLFKVNELVFMRLIEMLPDKIKCVALNDKFDTFYLNLKEDNVEIQGIVIPRIRL